MTKALGRQGFVPATQKIVAKFVEIILQVALELLHVAHLMLMTGRVIECHIKVEQ